MALYPWLSITRVMNYLAASTPSLVLLHLWPWWQWLIITVSGEKKSTCMCFQTSPTILFAESFIIPVSNEECTPVHSTSDFPSIIEGSERQKARVLPHGHPEQRGTKNWSHLSFAGSLLHQRPCTQQQNMGWLNDLTDCVYLEEKIDTFLGEQEVKNLRDPGRRLIPGEGEWLHLNFA